MRPKLKFSITRPRVNVNKQLTRLLSGYQDLVDRYGADDPLVQELKSEIDRQAQAQPATLATERRHGNALSDAWERHSEIASL
jgi:hypothetical protein